MNKERIKTILRIAKNIICWGMLILLVGIVVVFLTTRINGGTPSMFGFSIYRVSSGSMEPELSVGDVILDKKVDDVSTLKVGDVITYEGSGSTEGMMITHKVIVEPHTDENGATVLQTQGIANEIPDEPITADKVQSIMICKIPYLDTMYNLFLSPWGLLIFVALLILIFIDEVINLVRILTGNIPDEDEEDINTIIERIQREELQKKLDEKAKLAAEAHKKSEKNSNAAETKNRKHKKQKNNKRKGKSSNKEEAHPQAKKNKKNQAEKKRRKSQKKQRAKNRKRYK